MGHARALLALGKSRQVELAERIAHDGLSVRETERLVQAAGSAPTPARAGAAQRLDADSRRLQEELAESLGASVKLKPRSGGKGSVVIDYSSLDELQGIVGKLRRA
jgi:ParB family chromosome partitioning protein